jgi:hypothetical protein
MQHDELVVTQRLTPMILQLQRKDGRSTEKRGHPRRHAARAKRCAHLQAVCLPTRRGASDHWRSHAGAPMLIGGTCVDRESLPAARWRSMHVGEESGLVCRATKTKNEGEGG